MSWNGSGGAAAPQKPKAKAKKPSPVRGLVAGAVIVAAVVGCYFAFFSGSAKPQKEVVVKEPTKIKEVTPVAAPKAKEVPDKPQKVVEIRKVGDGKIMKYVNGKPAWMYPRDDYHGPVFTSGVHRVKTIEELTFKNLADRHIAGLLMIEPGDTIVGEAHYDPTFVKHFLKSFQEPEVPMPGDTEEQKELKRAVAEVKGELKARYDAGEDVMKILNDERENLRQLGAYKQELEQQVRQLSKDGNVSAKDIEDFVAAANQMLEKRGVKPMKINGFLKHQIRIKNKAAESKGNEQ